MLCCSNSTSPFRQINSGNVFPRAELTRWQFNRYTEALLVNLDEGSNQTPGAQPEVESTAIFCMSCSEYGVLTILEKCVNASETDFQEVCPFSPCCQNSDKLSYKKLVSCSKLNSIPIGRITVGKVSARPQIS